MIYDINLIPKTKKNTSSNTANISVLIFLLCILVIAVFGFYLPYLKKESLKDQIQDKEDELSSYSGTEDTFLSLMSESVKLNQANTLVEQIKSNKINMTEILSFLNDNTPDDLLVTSFSYETGLITIEGEASTYTEIAQFIVKLRNMNKVTAINFTHAEVEEESDVPDQSNNNKKINKFTLYVRLDVVDAFSVIQQTEATKTSVENSPEDTGTEEATSEQTANSEEQEGSQNEANQ
jgi:Tfp pilus assembly protein PilN